MSDLGDWFRAARKSRGMTLRDVGDAIGCSLNQIWKIEQGKAAMALFERAADEVKLDLIKLPDAATLGDRVKLARQAADLSVIEVAKRADITRSTVSRIESGRGHMANLEKVLQVVCPGTRPLRPRAIHKRRTSDIALTPWSFVEQVRYVIGGDIDLDPCGQLDDFVQPNRRYTIEQDGLHQPWDANRVFVNPPYSKSFAWLRRGLAEHHRDPNKVILFLVPVRSQTEVWSTIKPFAEILLLTGRLHFANEAGPLPYAAPHSSAVIIFGATTEILDRARETWRFLHISKKNIAA